MKTFFKENLLWIVISAFIIIMPTIWCSDITADASLLPRQFAFSIFLLILFISLIAVKGFDFHFCRNERIILYGLITFMSMHLVSSINIINGHEAFFHTIKEFSFCLYFFILYRLLINKYSGREILIKTILVSSAIFIIIGFVQLAHADFSKYEAATSQQSYYLTKIMEKVYSTCSNKNLFASLLFITLPTAIYGIVNYKRHNAIKGFWSIFCIAVALSNVFFVLMLLSRTVFAAFFVTILAAAILLYTYLLKIKPQKTGQPISKKLKKVLFASPIACVLALILFVCLTETKLEQTITERINITINPEKYGYRDNKHGESSVAMRTIIWGKTAEMIKDHPLIGSGPGQWQVVIPKYGLDEFNANLREGSLTFQRPHNDYLWIASEVGIIGLLGYLIFYFGIIAFGISNIKKATDNKVLTFNILAVSALIGWIVISSLDYPHERVEHNVMYLSLAAIILADKIKLSQQEDETVSNNKKWPALTFYIIGAAFCIINIQQSFSFFRGEAIGRLILDAHYKLNWNKVLRLTRNIDEQAYTLNNYTVPLPYYRGIALSMQGQDEAAIHEFDRALEMHPYHILTICAKGTSLCNLKKYDEAIEYFQKVLVISPRNPNALFNMGIAYYNKKDFKSAFNYMSQVSFDTKYKPANFDSSYITVCKFAAIAERDLYDKEKLIVWAKDDNRIIASVKKFQESGATEFSEILLEELGPDK